MTALKEVFSAIERATGKNPQDVRDEENRRFLFDGAVSVFMRPAWPKPSKVELQLESILKDLRGLRRKIEGMERFAAVLARQAQTADADREFERQLVEASGDLTKINALCERHNESRPASTDHVDLAAIHHLQELERCLIAPIERAIAVAPTGRGRPRNRHAHRIADYAAQAFYKLTGEMPTFWNGGETPYSRLVADLFVIADVKADPRKPIEAAMSKIRAAK